MVASVACTLQTACVAKRHDTQSTQNQLAQDGQTYQLRRMPEEVALNQSGNLRDYLVCLRLILQQIRASVGLQPRTQSANV